MMQSPIQLLKLSDEIFDYLSTSGLQDGETETILIVAAMLNYPELANICVLAGANIHAPEHNHAAIAHMLIQASNSKTHIIGEIPAASLQAPVLSPLGKQIKINAFIRNYAKTMPATDRVESNGWSNLVNLVDIWEKIAQPPKDESKIDDLQQKIAKRLDTPNGTRMFNFLHAAIEQEEFQVCELCIKLGTHLDLDRRKNDQGFSLYHFAAYSGNIPIVSLFIEKNANINTTAGRDNNTPLFIAAFFGHLDLVKYLVQHGANPTLRNDKNQSAVSLCEVLPGSYYVNHLLLLSQQPRDQAMRNNVKYSYHIAHKYKPCHEYLTQIISNRNEAIEQWKTFRTTPEGQRKLERLCNELISLIQSGFNKTTGYEQRIHDMATQTGYTELARLAKMLGAQDRAPHNPAATTHMPDPSLVQHMQRFSAVHRELKNTIHRAPAVPPKNLVKMSQLHWNSRK
jgi:hypothetical protein